MLVVLTLSCIPAVKSPLGLNVVGSGWLAAPYVKESVENMEAFIHGTHRMMQDISTVHNENREHKYTVECTLEHHK